MIDARRIGLSQHEFWRMTPPEFRVEVKAAEQRRRDDYRQAIFGAWYTASLTRSAIGVFSEGAKLRPLQSVIADFDRAMTPRPKHLPASQFEWLSGHLGIAARPISPEAKAAMERLRARGE